MGNNPQVGWRLLLRKIFLEYACRIFFGGFPHIRGLSCVLGAGRVQSALKMQVSWLGTEQGIAAAAAGTCCKAAAAGLVCHRVPDRRAAEPIHPGGTRLLPSTTRPV